MCRVNTVNRGLRIKMTPHVWSENCDEAPFIWAYKARSAVQLSSALVLQASLKINKRALSPSEYGGCSKV